MPRGSTIRVTGTDVAAHMPRALTLPFAVNGWRAMRGAGAR